MNLLVVDDSSEVLDLLQRAFAKEGHEVRVAATLAEAGVQLAAATPDVIVLDVQLPDGTGVAWCEVLRHQGCRVPILLLTAYSGVPQRVTGLDAGADDFLGKPFAMAELRARVRALARRGPVERTTVVEVGDAALDFGARRAIRAGAEVPVTGREWEVLELLHARRGRVVTRFEILETIWGEENDNTSASLDVIMGRIRRKLGANLIRTVRGEGYAFDDDG